MNSYVLDFAIALPVSSVVLVVFLLLSIYLLLSNNQYLEKLMLDPYSISQGKKLYTILTSGLIHADFQHLLFNAITYFFFAFPLERTIGSLNFFIVFFSSLIVSDIQTLVMHRNDKNYRALGASGAVSGVLYSYILFYPNSKISLFLLPIGIPAYLFAILYLIYCVWADKKQFDYVNHNAHFWGAVCGLIVTLFLFPDQFEKFIMNFT